ncbi:MAG TPA: dethiobiotin synthase [Baekduia sp.]|nr:dethiobiotin synthase [Baekduia sp.]
MRGIFVTGTDTEVGKSVVAAALTAGLAARGEAVAAFKPVVTGTDDPPEDGKPRDHDLLGACAGMAPEDVAPLRFGPPVSPHFAGQLAGTEVDVPALVAAARRSGEGRTLVAEGVGGILVPLTAGGYLVRDLIAELALPVVVVARPGLGTINHTLLTLESARGAGLDVRGVVLTPWPAAPSPMETSNRETIAALGAVDVAVLPAVEGFAPDQLARAGARLPLDRWLG